MSKSRKWIAGGILGLVALAAIVVLTATLLTTQPAAAVSAALAPAISLEQVAAAAPTVTPTVTARPNVAAKTDVNQYLDNLIKSFAAKLGVSEDKLNSAFADTVSETVDQAVKDGKLDANTATMIKATTKDGFKQLLPFLNNVVSNSGAASAKAAGKDGSNDSYNPLLGPAVDAVAKLLNITPEDLKKKLGSGQSLSDIAETQKVDVQKVKDTILNSIKTQLDALVASGKMTQAQADDLYKGASNVADKFINAKPGEADTKNQMFNPKALLLPALQHVATLLNTTPNDLLDKLKMGQSLAEIAQAQKVDVQKVKDALLADMKTQLDAAVKAGSLTQAQADNFYKMASDLIDRFVNNKPDANATPGGKK